MNREERQKENQLVNDLKEKRKSGGSKNWIIRKGKIVKKREETTPVKDAIMLTPRAGWSNFFDSEGHFSTYLGVAGRTL